VADEGIIELAALWAEAPAVSLPGALYQLVLLREWIVRNPVDASRFFTAGREVAEFSTVVAGVADPPSPEAVVRLADTVLSAAFDADLADALDRAGAFCRVVAAGRGHATPVDDTVNSRLGAGNLTMADNLDPRRACVAARPARLMTGFRTPRPGIARLPWAPGCGSPGLHLQPLRAASAPRGAPSPASTTIPRP